MIQYIMKKFVAKNMLLDKESQERYLQLFLKQEIVEKLCFMFWISFIFPFVPLVIIEICEDIQFSMITQIAIFTFFMLYCIGAMILVKFFQSTFVTFSYLLAVKVFFLVFTTKGKAICKEDFNTIKKVDTELYTLIETQKYRNHCWFICFKICEILKKGAIEFWEIKKFYPHIDEEDDGKDFTIHVLYVNNGWVFDTNSFRQYPIEELYNIYRARVCKTLAFDELSKKSYEEFVKEQKPMLTKWCSDHNCSMF